MGGDVASTPGIEPVTRARMGGLIFTVLVFALSRLACYLFICVCVLQLVKLPPALAIFGTKYEYERRSNKCCNCICQNIRINQNISTSKLGKKLLYTVFHVCFFLEYQSFQVYNPFLAVLL